MKALIPLILVTIGMTFMLVGVEQEKLEEGKIAQRAIACAKSWRDIAIACEHSQITVANHETH